LEPAKDDVKMGCSAIEYQLGVYSSRASKPPEEQKNVADTDTMILEVRLSGIDLSKQGTPTRRPWAGLPLEVRVQVYAVQGSDPLIRNRGDDV